MRCVSVQGDRRVCLLFPAIGRAFGLGSGRRLDRLRALPLRHRTGTLGARRVARHLEARKDHGAVGNQHARDAPHAPRRGECMRCAEALRTARGLCALRRLARVDALDEARKVLCVVRRVVLCAAPLGTRRRPAKEDLALGAIGEHLEDVVHADIARRPHGMVELLPDLARLYRVKRLARIATVRCACRCIRHRMEETQREALADHVCHDVGRVEIARRLVGGEHALHLVQRRVSAPRHTAKQRAALHDPREVVARMRTLVGVHKVGKGTPRQRRGRRA